MVGISISKNIVIADSEERLWHVNNGYGDDENYSRTYQRRKPLM